jgi:hypothetical protein
MMLLQIIIWSQWQKYASACAHFISLINQGAARKVTQAAVQPLRKRYRQLTQKLVPTDLMASV